MKFVFSKWLIDVGVVTLVEIRQCLIDVSQRIRGKLEAIGRGPVVPEACTEDTESLCLADGACLTILPIAIELIDAAR